MTIVCACLLTALGAAVIYLSHHQQRLLPAEIPAGTRLMGTLAIIAGACVWSAASGLPAGLAGTLTALMLVWILLPYLTWWRGKQAIAMRTEKR